VTGVQTCALPIFHKATVNTKPPYTVTGIIIHKLAASLFKTRGSKRGKKVAAYSPANTVVLVTFKSPSYSHIKLLYFPSQARGPLVLCLQLHNSQACSTYTVDAISQI